MLFREAAPADIPRLQTIRLSVKENKLSDPGLITEADYINYLTKRGKGWICEVEERITGFAIADLQGHNIWALFVHPEYDGQGIGRQLHNLMLQWYFSHTRAAVWLSTAPNTRAETFYKNLGWIETGLYGKGELKLELSYDDWRKGTAA